MIELTERVSHLDQALERFISSTAEAIAELKADNLRRAQEHDRMLAGHDRMLAGHDRMLAGHDRMLAGHDRMLAEMKADHACVIKELNQKMGELSNRLGTMVEDFVIPNIPRIAREYFGCQEILDFFPRRIRRHPGVRGREREFDVICVTEKAVLWCEAKSSPRTQQLEGFVAGLPEFLEYFPEYQGLRLIRMLASLQLEESAVRFLTRHKVYALALAGDTMEPVNFREVSEAEREGSEPV
jgi:hypothetical protein